MQEYGSADRMLLLLVQSTLSVVVQEFAEISVRYTPYSVNVSAGFILERHFLDEADVLLWPFNANV